MSKITKNGNSVSLTICDIPDELIRKLRSYVVRQLYADGIDPASSRLNAESRLATEGKQGVKS